MFFNLKLVQPGVRLAARQVQTRVLRAQAGTAYCRPIVALRPRLFCREQRVRPLAVAGTFRRAISAQVSFEG